MTQPGRINFLKMSNFNLLISSIPNFNYQHFPIAGDFALKVDYFAVTRAANEQQVGVDV